MKILADIRTAALILRRTLPEPTGNCDITPGSTGELGDIAAFLRQKGASRQFFPAYSAADFDGGSLTRGFDPADFVIGRQGGKIVAVAGLWDQGAYKQSIVDQYKGGLRWLRPVYNLWTRFSGAHPLPASGEHIRSAYASFIAVDGDDPDLFRPLLRRLYNMAVRRGLAYLMVGLSEEDPLQVAAREYLHIPYHSRIAALYWPEDEAQAAGLLNGLDGRPPYLEIGML